MGPWYTFVWSLCGAVCKDLFHTRIEGRENLPAGGFLGVANHLSFIDPPLLGWVIDREINFLARKSLWNSKLLGWCMTSVNSHPIDQERPDMAGLKRMIRLLNEGQTVLIFPEGSRSPDGKLHEGQPGAGLVAAKVDVPIVPIRMFGPHEAWPPGCKRIALAPFRVVIGKPKRIPEALMKSKEKSAYNDISQWMMREIAALE